MIKAILLGLVAVFGMLDGRWFGIAMLDRPLVMCTLVGVVMGDIRAGILIGATLELVFLGVINIGAATPPDIVTSSVIASAFAISSGKGTEVALALAMPIAVLAQSLLILVRVGNSYFQHKAEIYASKGESHKVAMTHIQPIVLYAASMFIPVFLCIYFGEDIVNSILKFIPDKVIDGLQIAAGLMPALGFAMLINMMISKRLIPYFMLGFLIAAYLKLDLIAVALIAICIAFIVNQCMDNHGDNNGSNINENGIEVL